MSEATAAITTTAVALLVPPSNHPDADVLRLAREISENDVVEESARTELPDPDSYHFLSSLCDPATLAMDEMHHRGLQLRTQLAETVLDILDGLRAKAGVVASDFRCDLALPDAIDWTTFDPLDAVGMSVLRDLLLMGPIDPGETVTRGFGMGEAGDRADPDDLPPQHRLVAM